MDKNVSFAMIIQYIQNDLSELIRDYSNINKNLKLKVNSIKDTFKILHAKLQPFINEENKCMEKFQIEIEKLKDDIEQRKRTMENQINILRAENNELIVEIEKMKFGEDIQEDRIREHKPHQQIIENTVRKTDEYYNLYLKSEEELSNYKANFEQIICILREEEKNRINLEEEISNLKKTLHNLNDEAQVISNKYEKKCQDYDTLDKINNEMRNNYYDLKPKYEELVKINSELKSKFIEKTNEYNNLCENNKGIFRKISSLQKRNEELEKENAKNIADISSKEERLIALRNMNVKLESKLSEVMKKWEKIKYFEDASTQIQKKYNDLYEIIANLNIEKSNLSRENLELRGQYLKKKEETIDTAQINFMEEPNLDKNKSMKRNPRSNSLLTSNSIMNSKTNFY